MKEKYIQLLEATCAGKEEKEVKKDGEKEGKREFFYKTMGAAEAAAKAKGVSVDKIVKHKDGFLIREDVALDEEKEEKEEKKTGKRGRPKKDADDEKEGIRDITLVATIKIDGKKETKEKKLKGVKVDEIDAEKDKFEKQVNKEYDYDADVTVKVKIGDYEGSADAEDHMYDDEGEGSDDEDSSYSLGRKEK